MAEYLAKMKSTANNLLLAGSPISTNDLITQTLASLDIDFNPFVVQLFDKDELTWVELQALLLTYENRLKQLSSLNASFQSQANIATKTKNTNHTNSENSQFYRSN